jgi:hypothetical protein
MMDFLWLVEARIQQAIPAEGKSPGREDEGEKAVAEVSEATKKQGRRRSIPPTTLPAPDIEIGSRHPVNSTLRR